ncbi:MAG TPA: thioesterase family protein [bacterium]|jgi:YbgC/YbaW family acyl-CoA thioester hydrolase
MTQVFRLDMLVRDYELDQYGVVNNAVYLNYLEHARHEFLHGVGIDPAAVARSGSALALSEIHVRYRSSLRSRERFAVEITIGEVRGARLAIHQRIVATDDGRTVLEAQAVAVFLDANGRPRRVAPEHRAAFAPYLTPQA